MLNIDLIDVDFWWMLFAINCSNLSVVNLMPVISVVLQYIRYEKSKRNIETVLSKTSGKCVSEKMIKIDDTNDVHYLLYTIS